MNLVNAYTDVEMWFLFAIQVCMFAVQIWALADCAIRRAAAFPAAGKLSKPAWLGITAAGAAIQGLFGFPSLLALIGFIASLVYLTDVRPAVREITGGPSRW